MKKSLFLMGLFALLISCKGNVSKNIPQTDKPRLSPVRGMFLKPISLNR